ncbi:cytochrome P450 [Micromonospora sp. NPDC018662]|uniref:cytochrome P450 n=1 Tax=Micromonospora sp. NPDC018662 TaxID=3364238 RepID=UPI00379D66B6
MTPPAPIPERLLDPDAHAGDEPYRIWRWMRRSDPVHWHEPGDLPGFWSLTRYRDIRDVYLDPERFSSAHGVLLRPTRRGDDAGAGLTLALTDPPRHRHLRAMVADRFSERCARGLAQPLRAQIRAVLADAVERGECDFAHDVGARLAISLICRLLGVPEEDHELLLAWTTEAFEAGTSLVADGRIVRYLVELMGARRAEPDDDAMSLLVTGTADGDPLTEMEVLLNCENLVGATENAGLAMTAGLLAFLQHPQQWRLVRDDRDRIPTAVEEVLRWTSSATHSMRTATRDVEIGGRRIAAGDRVVLWIPSANRDESVFAEPDRFDVTRAPNRHLALGAGPHVCVGGTMARHQMRILCAELLDMVERVEPAGPVVPLRSIAVSGQAHLPVRLTARRTRRSAR